MNLNTFFTKEKLFGFIFEVLVIFTGITLSFFFDNWKQKQSNREKEVFYLQSIQEDLEDDIKELEQDIILYEKIGKALSFYANYDFRKNLSPDSLTYNYQYFYRSGTVFMNTSGFDALKSTGSMNIVQNKELLRKIIKTYQNDFPRITYWENNFMEMKRTIVLPYFTKKINLNPQENNFLTLYQDKEFFNIVFTSLNYNRIMIQNYKPILQNCKDLLTELKKQ